METNGRLEKTETKQRKVCGGETYGGRTVMAKKEISDS